MTVSPTASAAPVVADQPDRDGPAETVVDVPAEQPADPGECVPCRAPEALGGSRRPLFLDRGKVGERSRALVLLADREEPDRVSVGVGGGELGGEVVHAGHRVRRVLHIGLTTAEEDCKHGRSVQEAPMKGGSE